MHGTRKKARRHEYFSRIFLDFSAMYGQAHSTSPVHNSKVNSFKIYVAQYRVVTTEQYN